MAWLRRALRLPVHESNVGLVLIFCIISMSFMSIALVWQAQIIANQREAIQWLYAALLTQYLSCVRSPAATTQILRPRP